MTILIRKQCFLACDLWIWHLHAGHSQGFSIGRRRDCKPQSHSDGSTNASTLQKSGFWKTDTNMETFLLTRMYVLQIEARSGYPCLKTQKENLFTAYNIVIWNTRKIFGKLLLQLHSLFVHLLSLIGCQALIPLPVDACQHYITITTQNMCAAPIYSQRKAVHQKTSWFQVYCLSQDNFGSFLEAALTVNNYFHQYWKQRTATKYRKYTNSNTPRPNSIIADVK